MIEPIINPLNSNVFAKLNEVISVVNNMLGETNNEPPPVTLDAKTVTMDAKIYARLKSMCVDSYREMRNGNEDEDIPHYIYEEVMMWILGKHVFSRLRGER